jgi:hypothetical protein
MTEVHDTSEGSAAAATRDGLNATIARLFFGLGCGMSLVGAAAYGLLGLTLEPGMRAMLVTVCSVLALVFALSMVLLRRAPLSTVMLVVGWSGVTVVALTAVGVGEGPAWCSRSAAWGRCSPSPGLSRPGCCRVGSRCSATRPCCT